MTDLALPDVFQALIQNVPAGKNTFLGKDFTNCFKGTTVKDFLVDHFRISEKQAKAIGNRLVKAKYINHVSTNLLPFTYACFYRYNSDMLRLLPAATEVPTATAPATGTPSPSPSPTPFTGATRNSTEILAQSGSLTLSPDLSDNELLDPEVLVEMKALGDCIGCTEAEAQAKAEMQTSFTHNAMPSPDDDPELDDVDDTDPLFALNGIQVVDMEGKEIPTAAAFLEIYPQLQAKNVGLVAIGSGTPIMAKAFAEEFNFTAPLYVDQKRLLYQALNLRRGLRYVVTKKTLAAAQAVRTEGFAQGKTAGDILQLGGAFIISSKQGVLWEHKEEYAGDMANLEEVLQVINA